jgi:HAD superfamily hydrolase (TIGR01509 family)
VLYHELLFVAGGKERVRYYIEHFHPDAGTDADLVTRIHQAKIRHFSELAEQMPLRPGVGRLVREARAAGVKLAVATTASVRGVRAVLSQDPELLDAFDVFATGEVAERKKPYPDVYLWALERLGLSAAECVAIEDSSVGLSASRAAGIATVITTNDDTRAHDFTGAAVVLTDLGEPGAPAQCLSGASPPDGIVNLAYLNTIITPRVFRDASPSR